MEQNIVNYFLSLVQVDSESKNELEIALKISRDLEDLGAKVTFDDTTSFTGSNTGNLYAFIEGDESLEPVLLSAHLDTVVPGKNVTPVIKDGIIFSDGSTILGSDDKSGVAQIIFGVKELLLSGKPHPPIEILFTVCEEIGLLGVQNADLSLFRSKQCMVLDTHDIGTILIGAPSQNNLFINVRGKKAHAGTDPDKGINAILVASDAITKIPLGRIDEETTSNIGTINGGEATNIIPDNIYLKGEIRSHSDKQLDVITDKVTQVFRDTAANYKVGDTSATVDIKVEKNYSSFYIDESDFLLNVAKKASQALGMNPLTYKGGGGSDANIFNKKGIGSIVLGTGMNDVHTTDENIKVSDLEQGAQWIKLILIMLGEHK